MSADSDSNDGEQVATIGGDAEAQLPEVTAPIIVNLGKKKRRAIKRLKRGKGRAMDEVMDVMEQVQASLGAGDGAQKTLVPVVVLYSRKRRRRKGLW